MHTVWTVYLCSPLTTNEIATLESKIYRTFFNLSYSFIHMHSHQCLEQFTTSPCMLTNFPCASNIFNFS